jgi:hypothetical protein
MQSEYRGIYNDLIFLSYRKGFKPLLIEKKEFRGQKVQNLSTDCGWGCTIRCTQMLIANAIKRTKVMDRLEILRLFDDSSRG